MGEVILFPGMEEEMTPRKLLKLARERKFDSVVIIGVKDSLPTCFTTADVAGTLFLLELAKRGLFEE